MPVVAPVARRVENRPLHRDGREPAIVEPLEHPLVIGHRGAAGHAPENTLASFDAAVTLGVDAVEFDVQFSKDGVPLILHDETLERMTGVAVRPRDYDHEALRGFDLGVRFGDAFRGERLPSVEEAARRIPPGTGLHVEIKDYEPPSEMRLRSLLAVLDRNGGLDRVVLSSPHEELLVVLRRMDPAARTGLLLFRDVRVPVDAARRAAHIGCVSVHPNAGIVGPELVNVCHRHGMKLFAFTVNERSAMRKLGQMGVDGCFTDYPDRLREAAS